MTKTKIYGDFQTPSELAIKIGMLLKKEHVNPKTIIEPTSGLGNILFAMIDIFNADKFIGLELNPEYVAYSLKKARNSELRKKIQLIEANFFDYNWIDLIKNVPKPILFIGNLPWVTNTALSKMNGKNLPVKMNKEHLRGIQALTGKSNFDISEWMIIKLLDTLSSVKNSLNNVIAILCKSTVARKVLNYAYTHQIPINNSKIYKIDSKRYFNAAVDACLFVIHTGDKKSSYDCELYKTLSSNQFDTRISVTNGYLIANQDLHSQTKKYRGKFKLEWRSGIKHDLKKIMELTLENRGQYRNGLGEIFELENDFLYPLIKGSDIANKRIKDTNRRLIVTQYKIGKPTNHIKSAPLTWEYLNKHKTAFEKRKSSIYKNKPDFSIFGVGPYSFAKWKVAISGLHKNLNFALINPIENKAVMLDDTSYFLPLTSEEEANYYLKVLKDQKSQDYLNSIIFWEDKRPIKKDILQSLDLDKVKLN
ncbi:MAG: SAM-dependent methyltransferase [Candidatus Hodarchaeales archaeon]|jgi:hypothetical protein